MTITYPLLTVTDDSGTILSGATVSIASVLDKAGGAVANHGATLNASGPNVSVDYDAEAKGEAWITLAITKAGSTITGLNAAPSFYLARDSSRIVQSLPAVAPSLLGGLPTADGFNRVKALDSAANPFFGPTVRIDSGLVVSATATQLTVSGLPGGDGQYLGHKFQLAFADGSELVTDACTADSLVGSNHVITVPTLNRVPQGGDGVKVLGR